MTPESRILDISPSPEGDDQHHKLDHSLLKTHRVAVEEALYPQREENNSKIDAQAFRERLEEMLKETQNPSLKAGLTILKGILLAHPDQLFAVELDKHDGAQTVFAVLLAYIKSNMEEIFPKLEKECPEIKKNRDQFTVKYIINASPEELIPLYLSQLTHIAYHIIRYDYQPINKLLILQGEAKSTLAMSMYGSLFAISADQQGFLAKYFRLGIRDSSQPDKALSVHTGKLKYFSIKTGERFGLPEGNSIGQYADFSSIMILAVKKGSITQEESTFMHDNMTHASTVLCKKEIKDMIKLYKQHHS